MTPAGGGGGGDGGDVCMFVCRQSANVTCLTTVLSTATFKYLSVTVKLTSHSVAPGNDSS